MFQRSHLKTGMVVRSEDGVAVGRVHAITDDHFEIEKGHLFKRSYLCPFGEIAEIRGGELYLMHRHELLRDIDIEERYEEHRGLGGELGLDSAGVQPSDLHFHERHAIHPSGQAAAPGDIPGR